MSVVLDALSIVLLLAGAFFFTAGTAGLLRFPDLRSQLHSLTKADNLGLGLIFASVALQIGSWRMAVFLLVAWILILGAASVSAQTLAGLEADAVDTGTDPTEPR